MLYLLAIFLPPIAIFLCGKPFQAIFNFIMCALFIVISILSLGLVTPTWLIPVIHAWIVIRGHSHDKRTNKIIEALKNK